MSVSVSTENSEISQTKIAATTTPKCIICGENSSPKIVKDENFVKMMSLYWAGIEVDVKPIHNKDYDLCAACFYNLKAFYETNDICIYFEGNLKMLRHKILCQNLKGILKRHEEHIPLMAIHTQIQEKWGTKLEPVDGKNALEGYKVTTSIEADKSGEGDSSNLTKSSSAVVTNEVISNKEKEKGPSQALKRAQNGTKTHKPKRKKAKKSVWSSSSENTTEELSDSSDI